MVLRRKEYPLLKISVSIKRDTGERKQKEYAREPGQIGWITALFFLLFLGILLCTCLQIFAYRASSLYLEDALAASNLASAVVNLEEYGRSHVLLVESPEEAYERFCSAVYENLHLDENWEGSNKALISGKVKVESYIIYNVKNDIVTVDQVVGDGGAHQWQGSLGTVAAPNGIVIESTSIYSELSFPVDSFFGITVNARKGKLVDIVADREEDGSENKP